MTEGEIKMRIKNNKEQVAELFNSPNRVTFREFLKTNTGEYNDIDFKGDYIENSELAKHIIAMANSGGGVITFGIEEDENNSLNPVGIELKDKTEIEQDLSNYIPNSLDYELHIFQYEDEVEWKKLKNKNFLMITVQYTPEKIPFLPKKDGGKINMQDIYCRKNSSTKKVDYEDIQEILVKRFESNEKIIYGNDLEDDLNQLQILTSYISLPKSLLFINNTLFKSIITELTTRKIAMIEKELKIPNEEKSKPKKE